MGCKQTLPKADLQNGDPKIRNLCKACAELKLPLAVTSKARGQNPNVCAGCMYREKECRRYAVDTIHRPVDTEQFCILHCKKPCTGPKCKGKTKLRYSTDNRTENYFCTYNVPRPRWWQIRQNA